MTRDLNAALFIFKINVEMYPGSSGVYDSYGEALMKNGQRDSAIENYKKSVWLNPGNTNAIQALRNMGIEVEIPIIEVPEAILETYVGKFELLPGFNIAVTRNGKQLFVQATGQSKFELSARSFREFYLRDGNLMIVFSINDQGVADSLKFLQSGTTITGKKIN